MIDLIYYDVKLYVPLLPRKWWSATSAVFSIWNLNGKVEYFYRYADNLRMSTCSKLMLSNEENKATRIGFRVFGNRAASFLNKLSSSCKATLVTDITSNDSADKLCNL